MSGLQLDLEHFGARVLQDALTEATAVYWERRAAAISWAAPRPGDFNGRATPAELAARSARCQRVATACRRHAALIRQGRDEPISPDVWDVLAEAA